VSLSHHELHVGHLTCHLRRVILPLCSSGPPPDNLDSPLLSSPTDRPITPPYPSSIVGTLKPDVVPHVGPMPQLVPRMATAPQPTPRVASASCFIKPPGVQATTSDPLAGLSIYHPVVMAHDSHSTHLSCCRGHQARCSSTTLCHHCTPDSVSGPILCP
jgi:hypothetical protein